MGWLEGVTGLFAKEPRSWRAVPRLVAAHGEAPVELQQDLAKVLDGVWPFPGVILQFHQVGPAWYIKYGKRKRYAWLHGEHVRQAESCDATVQGVLRTVSLDEMLPWVDAVWQHFYGRPVLVDEAARDVQLTGDEAYEPAEDRLSELWHAPRIEDGELLFFAVAVTGIIQKVHCGRSVRFERICAARRSRVL
ncbi:MAG: hypothetical protein ACI9MC_002234 [Kiritimatiellia bacterium]|jgi:hypothetical protein